MHFELTDQQRIFVLLLIIFLIVCLYLQNNNKNRIYIVHRHCGSQPIIPQNSGIRHLTQQLSSLDLRQKAVQHSPYEQHQLQTPKKSQQVSKILLASDLLIPSLNLKKVANFPSASRNKEEEVSPYRPNAPSFYPGSRFPHFNLPLTKTSNQEQRQFQNIPMDIEYLDESLLMTPSKSDRQLDNNSNFLNETGITEDQRQPPRNNEPKRRKIYSSGRNLKPAVLKRCFYPVREQSIRKESRRKLE